MVEASDQSAFVVRPRAVAVTLFGVTAGLVGVSVVLNVFKIMDVGVPDWLVDLFRLNFEDNIPSYFSGILLLTASALCAFVWKSEHARRRPGWRSWIMISAVFAFLSFDELFQVHEALSEPVRDSLELPDVLRFAWVLPYLLVIVAAIAMFWPAWRALDRRFKVVFALAGFTYVLGAVGFETIGGAIYTGESNDIWYGLAYTTEETLEMLGLVTFIYGLLGMLGGTTLRFSEGSQAQSGSPPRQSRSR